MALQPADRLLIRRCLNHDRNAWNDFVDRFLGLIYHVIHHTAHLRSAVLKAEDVEDLAADALLQIVANDYGVLRNFQGRSSLPTYLTVIVRRIVVHELAKRAAAAPVHSAGDGRHLPEPRAHVARDTRLESMEEVQKLLGGLKGKTREVVRLFYLEGRSYEEISAELEIPVNSVGPVLSRAKQALRERIQARHKSNGKKAIAKTKRNARL